MLECVAHAFGKERGLQATTAQLWDGSRAPEQSYSFMREEYSCGARLTVKFSEEAHTVLPSGRDVAELQQKILKLGMIVGPAPHAYVVPELRLFRSDNAYLDIVGMLHGVSFNPTVENVADLHRSVPTGAKQAQGRDANQGTHFMLHPRPAVEKEAFDRVQRGRGQFLEEAESKTLGGWRVDPIEDGVCACAFNPFGAAAGKYSAARFGELKARMAFGTL